MQGSTLYIGNIGAKASKGLLNDLFSRYGRVIEIKILGKNAFGFVEMSEESEAIKAKDALNGFNIEGRNLIVNEARPPAYARGRNFRR
ncbi:MAG: RNA-binding protein [Spirochaetes bacterium]|nr:RNA-binding protein [Spirochaetota bacterium]